MMELIPEDHSDRSFTFLEMDVTASYDCFSTVFKPKNSDSLTSSGLPAFTSSQHFSSFAGKRKKTSKAMSKILGRMSTLRSYCSTDSPKDISASWAYLLINLIGCGFPVPLICKAAERMANKTKDPIWRVLAGTSRLLPKIFPFLKRDASLKNT
mmetsp:Transcript_9311/g.12200  ORF Transcript_9311/g.12200 Transcript_9311/m.12200 type:complete len:154 (-) Transcript_9311:263-724(-)